MPYNSAATQTKTSDSMIGRSPPSRPHRKSTPSQSASTRIEHARELAMRISNCCTRSLIIMDTWRAIIPLGPVNFEYNVRACDALKVRARSK